MCPPWLKPPSAIFLLSSLVTSAISSTCIYQMNLIHRCWQSWIYIVPIGPSFEPFLLSPHCPPRHWYSTPADHAKPERRTGHNLIFASSHRASLPASQGVRARGSAGKDENSVWFGIKSQLFQPGSHAQARIPRTMEEDNRPLHIFFNAAQHHNWGTA